jgi:surfactin synthase thioesterase subunit
MLPGGHFFLHSAHTEVVRSVASDLAGHVVERARL